MEGGIVKDMVGKPWLFAGVILVSWDLHGMEKQKELMIVKERLMSDIDLRILPGFGSRKL